MRTVGAVALLIVAVVGGLLTVPGVRHRLLFGSSTAATFRNAVIDTDFPDPNVLLASDGKYYAYATQTIKPHGSVNIHIATSVDLVHWKLLGDALPVVPRWSTDKHNYWAPDVIQYRGRYIMYYAAEPNRGAGMCLAVASAVAPAGPFHDMGTPLLCGQSIEDIDPTPFDDPKTGKHLLFWGSGGAPIRAQELTPDRMHFASGSHPIPILSPQPYIQYENLIEGPWVQLHAGYYYLFYSGDACCGAGAHYAVMVARARRVLGPYTKLAQARHLPDSVIVRSSPRWFAPGGNSVIVDKAGQEWMVYHAIDNEHPSIAGTGDTQRVMLIDRIQYRDGWPSIAGNQPSERVEPAPQTR